MAHHVHSILERLWETRCLCTVVADYEPINLYDDAACVGCHTVPRGTTNAVYMCLPVDDAYMAYPVEFCMMHFPLKVCLCTIAFLVLLSSAQSCLGALTECNGG